MRSKSSLEQLRLGYTILMFFSTLLYIIVLAFLNKAELTNVYCMVFVGIFFFILMIFAFESFYQMLNQYDDVFRNYKKLSLLYLFSCIFMAVQYFVPQFFEVVIVLPIIISVVINMYFGITVFAFLSIVYCVLNSGSIYLFAYFIFLGLFGCFIANSYKVRKNILMASSMVICTSISTSAIFFFMENHFLTMNSVLYSFASGVVSSFILAICMYFVERYVLKWEEIFLKEVCQERYVLLQQLKKFSMKYYIHCLKVSKVCTICAAKIGVDEALSKAGGLYYTIGKLEDENYVKNNISIGLQMEFPQRLIQLLSESNALEKKPSSIESGLVLIVDKVISEFERQKEAQIDFNQDSITREIIIHKVMNDLSMEGLLDDSGISMNMFLKIKDIIVKESKKYDNPDGK